MIPFQKEFAFEYGKAHIVSPLIRRLVASNPGRFTGPGTGTFIIGRGRVAVIDPGPGNGDHFAALQAELRDETVTHVLVTHQHIDHSPLGASWPIDMAPCCAAAAGVQPMSMAGRCVRRRATMNGSGQTLNWRTGGAGADLAGQFAQCTRRDIHRSIIALPSTRRTRFSAVTM
jgi:hypothetical protein